MTNTTVTDRVGLFTRELALALRRITGREVDATETNPILPCQPLASSDDRDFPSANERKS